MFGGDKRSNIKTIIMDYSSHASPYRPNENSMEWDRSIEQQEEEYSPDIANTLRSLKAEIKSCKEDNNGLIKAHERLSIAQDKKAEFNAMILQSLSDLQKQGQLRISHAYMHQQKTNGAYGSRY